MTNTCEADWKHLRQLKPIALDRYCTQVLAEVARITADTSLTAHERYLSVYRLIQDRDRLLAMLFNDTRRATMMQKTYLLRQNGLLTDDEWAGFSDETKRLLASD